jgi:hypothetical protein
MSKSLMIFYSNPGLIIALKLFELNNQLPIRIFSHKLSRKKYADL